MTTRVSPLTLAAHAAAAIPGLQVEGLCDPQTNDGSMARQGIVDAEGNRWVVCTPLTDIAGVGIEAQATLLHILHKAHSVGRLPFEVPAPVAYSRENAKLHVLIHRYQRGDVMTWEDIEHSPTLAQSLGRAIAALHELPEAVIERTGLPMYSANDCRERHLALLAEGAAAWTIPPNLYDRWETALEDLSLFKFQPTPVHGDMGPDSFMTSHGVVTSMAAFASAHLGDPAEDLAWIVTSEYAAAVEQFTTAYVTGRQDSSDLHLLARAQLISELALVRWLIHGVRTKDMSIIVDAKRMLTDLSDVLGDEPLLASHVDKRADWTRDDWEAEAAPVHVDENEELDPHAPTIVLADLSDQVRQSQDEETASSDSPQDADGGGDNVIRINPSAHD
ncbi:MAG: phosphotransferase [Actinomycetaceae bacterium]|nr:phosphotransferase [Actinomycetaceae bacterium]